jgi:hypothetical protein
MTQPPPTPKAIVTDAMRLDKLEHYLMHEHGFRDPVPDEIQSEIRMLFNEALAGGPNMNGDAGPRLGHNHALDCVWAAKRIMALPNPEASEIMREALTDKQINDIQEAAMEATEMYVSAKMVRVILEQAEALSSICKVEREGG